MPRSTLAGAAALLSAPIVVIAGTLIQPTLSDDPAGQLAAFEDHRGASIAGIALGTVAVVLLIAGAIWLAGRLGPRASRLALAGAVLAVLGSLVVLFEDGVSAAGPSIAGALDPAHATAVLDRVHDSAAVSALEPLSLLGDLGLALLGAAVVMAGAPLWTAGAIAVGAFGEGIGFATGTRGLVVAGFVLLLAGLAQAVRTVAGPVAHPRREVVSVGAGARAQ